jgi:hypothetical protein
MIESIPLLGQEQVAYRQDELKNVFMGFGIVLLGLSLFFDQPGLAALLTIAFLLRVVKHRA